MVCCVRVMSRSASAKWAQRGHYAEVLGLIETARDAQGRVYLKAWDEHDHHSVVLREATDPGMDYMGWRVDSTTTLKKLAADVEESGLASEMTWLPAGEHPMTGERFRFTISTGHAMELFAEKEKVGNGLLLPTPMLGQMDCGGWHPLVSIIACYTATIWTEA